MPKKFPVYESTWLRGDEGNSYLLRESDGMMCCLGHLSLSCGLVPDDIRGLREPDDIAEIIPKEMDGLVDTNKYNEHHSSPIACRIMGINDDPGLTDQERKEQLTEAFAKIGLEPEFVPYR